MDGDERGRFLGELWNRLGDPRLEEGLLAEEDLAALGEKLNLDALKKVGEALKKQAAAPKE